MTPEFYRQAREAQQAKEVIFDIVDKLTSVSQEKIAKAPVGDVDAVMAEHSKIRALAAIKVEVITREASLAIQEANMASE